MAFSLLMNDSGKGTPELRWDRFTSDLSMRSVSSEGAGLSPFAFLAAGAGVLGIR